MQHQQEYKKGEERRNTATAVEIEGPLDCVGKYE